MPRPIKDLTGQRFGRLTAVARVKQSRMSQWRCICDCGAEAIVYAAHLLAGRTKSCGCYRLQRNSETKLIDLTGQRFGRLTVLSRSAHPGRVHWCCACGCGQEVAVRANHLKSGHTTSCGCTRADRSSQASTTHGMSNTSIYAIWNQMIQRCTNPNLKAYPNYGGRGIMVAARWQVFENFLADMGERPKGLTLERKNNEGPYSPENCVWASRTIQAINRRNTVHVMVEGRRMAITEAMKLTGKSRYELIRQVLREAAADGNEKARA